MRPALSLFQTLYQRGLDADSLAEEFHQGLMRCYAQLDRNSEALAVYVRLKQLLSLALGVQPSTSTQELYRSLRETRDSSHRSAFR